MTGGEDHAPAPQTTTIPNRPRKEVLAAAVAVLTEAARLTSSDSDGRTEQADWAEFVTQALAGAAANIGGIERVLAGRPGSWEADYVRNLLTSTVGHDEAYLLEHRTEPLVVELYVDQILTDAETWKAYDDAEAELSRRWDASGIPTATTGELEAGALLPPATEDQERQLDELAELEERLREQQDRDWAEYGQALKTNVEAAAARLPGLQVPVVVTVHLNTWPPADVDYWDEWDAAHRVRAAAIEATPLPAPDPLQRASGNGAR